MASRFRALGFDTDEAGVLLLALDEMPGARDSCRVGWKHRYEHWADPSGAALWIQKSVFGRVLGMAPHFDGTAELPVRLTRRVERGEGGPLDGAFYGWANPSSGAADSGDYPVVFDAPDAAMHRNLALPATMTVQLTAFAQDIEAYDSEEDFYASQGAGELGYAARSYIPAGLFQSDGDIIDPPESFCVMTGIIIQSDALLNRATGHRFHWAMIDTLGGLFDVVAPAVDLPGPPRPGAVLHGSFWLSGMIRAKT